MSHHRFQDHDFRWEVQTLQEQHVRQFWSETLKWEYEWNPRDQMTRAIKYVNGSANNAGSVAFEYCLSCDGALSKRFEYGAGTGSAEGSLVSGRRYEYDGLALLRVDELYDNDSNGLEENDAWRTTEVNTHRPGTLAALLGKRVYTYSSGTTGTPSGSNDYSYAYDAVGNVVAVFHDSGASDGDEAFYFTQDAFGNELEVNTLGGSDWDDAADDGVTEHQTGKWVDGLTGLYYFQARWLDAGVGRFVSWDATLRSSLRRLTPDNCCSGERQAAQLSPSPGILVGVPEGANPYAFGLNAPPIYTDPTGNFSAIGFVILGVLLAIIALLALMALLYAQCRATLAAVGLSAAAIFANVSAKELSGVQPQGITIEEVHHMRDRVDNLREQVERELDDRNFTEKCNDCNAMLRNIEAILDRIRGAYPEDPPAPQPTDRRPDYYVPPIELLPHGER